MVTYPSDFLASIPIATCERSPPNSVHETIEWGVILLIRIETYSSARETLACF
jgi:hypothetical protein